MGAHEAGALHSPGYGGVATVPAWLRPPGDVNELLPQLWSATVRRGAGGALEVGGLPVAELAARFGTPAYILDEADFRARAVAYRAAVTDSFADLAGADVYYAGKAFLCTAVARWVAEDGLCLDVCSGGELAVALRAGVDPARIGLHGNNKSDTELERAVAAGVGRIVVDSLEEVGRVADVAARHGVRVPVMIRVTVGVEAHTHEYIATAHEDQKFGVSLSGGVAAATVRAALDRPELDVRGIHSHIGSQIFDTGGFEVAARRVLGLVAQVEREHGVVLPEVDLGGGFGIAYTSEHDPLEPKALADQMAELVARECRGLGIAVPRISVEPGRAVAGPSTFTLYTVGAVKDVELDHGAVRRYVAVDGGMSDNIRTALYDADYSCTLASRESAAPPVLARIVGKHCESGDIVVRDEFLPGDAGRGDLVAVPGTGAYCRSMASQYNHVPRPPVVAVRDGEARVLVRRETE
ncbi:MAG: diaminopimelate decarboxylase, partial [Actinobacteria bacterium]|nr:diaminopimelate decarboxylase [Actinomycetota bacterium]